jgi:N-acetylglucosamine kinase-like BadF-type ATPase
VTLVVGIDAGGTKTLGLAAEVPGVPVRSARSGGANLHLHGELSVEKTLAAVLDELCPDDRPDAVCVGMAGVDRPGEDAVVRAMLRRLGYRANAQVVNDAVIALRAASDARAGVVVIAGTGSIAYGVDASGRTARAGGLGPLLADEGSAAWVAHLALVAAVRAADGREAATALLPAMLERLEAPSASDLVPIVYGGAFSRERLAELAPVVSECAARGDGAAQTILDRAARELALAARAVTRSLALSPPFPVVLSGGFLLRAPGLAERFAQHLELPGALPHRLEREPAEGALALAFEMARRGARGS